MFAESGFNEMRAAFETWLAPALSTARISAKRRSKNVV
jgi:hypothetical protein